MQKANHRNCVQSQWGKSVSKECVQKVDPQTTTPDLLSTWHCNLLSVNCLTFTFL